MKTSTTPAKPKATAVGSVELTIGPLEDVDLGRLEEQWATQHRFARERYARIASLNKAAAEAQQKLKVIKAEVAKDVRANPDRYGYDSIKNKEQVEDAVTLSERVKVAEAAIIEADYRVDLGKAAIAEVEHRKRALEKEVDLFLGAYFAKPKKPAPGKAADRAFGRSKA